jgi:hypothetical protein
MRIFTALLLAASIAAAQPRFSDRAAELGLKATPDTYRVALVDVDGDGWSDALLQDKSKGHPINPGGPVRLYLNRPAKSGRTFELAEGAIPAVGAGRLGDGARLTGVFVIAGDVNNDGLIDLFRATYNEPATHKDAPDTGERNAILLGCGKPGAPRFEAVALPDSGPVTTCGAAFLDYDRDGNLDLFVGNWYVHYGSGLMAHADRLYRGDGKGGFADVTESAGMMTKGTIGEADSHRPTYGVSHCDIDGDGWEDIATATYGRQRNRLWRNNGDGTFTDWAPRLGFDGDDDRSGKYPEWIRGEPGLKDRKDEPGYRAHGNSFSPVPDDVDNDGDTDLFVCEIAHSWAGSSSDLSALLVNEGAGAKMKRLSAPFLRKDMAQKWQNQGDYMAAWADFDNDGWLDLALGSGSYPDEQRLRVFRQKAPLEFEDVTKAWGIDFRDVQAMSVEDVDGDGGVDILVTGQAINGRTAPALSLWMNTAPKEKNWIELTLVGPAGSNRAAIGAVAILVGSKEEQRRTVRSATGHFGLAPSRTIHFGLDRMRKPGINVHIRWPDAKGTVEKQCDFAFGERVFIRDGKRVPR